MRPPLVCLVVAILALLPLTPAGAQHPAPSTDTTRAAARSVVRILARWPGHQSPIQGTGFVSGKPGQVVTALHVVVGARSITVEFEDGTQRTAGISHSLPEADLVMLAIENPLDAPPLKHRNKAATIDSAVMVGYAYDRARWSDVHMRIRAADGGELRDILGGTARDEIRALGFPSLRTPVIDLEGNAVPGNSGAPVLDSDGFVIGVLQGGLESGTTGYIWAIPASRIEELASSAHRRVDLRADVSKVFFGDFHFGERDRAKQFRDMADRDQRSGLVYIGARSLFRLRSTTDDRVGLSQLEGLFRATGRSIPEDAMFDLYADQESGARIVVPAGVALKLDAESIAYTRHGGDLAGRVRLTRVGSVQEAQMVSLGVEQWIATHRNDMREVWFADPNWSYLAAVPFPNGSAVRRVAATRSFGNLMTGYAFTTFAQKGQQFLDAVAMQVPRDPRRAYSQPSFHREWVEMVIATHLTNYSQ